MPRFQTPREDADDDLGDNIDQQADADNQQHRRADIDPARPRRRVVRLLLHVMQQVRKVGKRLAEIVHLTAEIVEMRR